MLGVVEPKLKGAPLSDIGLSKSRDRSLSQIIFIFADSHQGSHDVGSGALTVIKGTEWRSDFVPCGVQRRLCAREVNRITLRWEWYSPLRESDPWHRNLSPRGPESSTARPLAIHCPGGRPIESNPQDVIWS